MVPAVLATAVFVAVVVIALRIQATYDVGLAYQGGQAAWQNGHPEYVHTWISTPFLAMVMAVISRLMSAKTAAVLDTVVNSILFLTAAVTIWTPLRGRIAVWFWWATLLAFVAYAPIASSIFWMQFNIVALSLATVAFLLADRRPSLAGFLVALSIGIKPLVVLLPIALLWRRQTRRSGLWSIAWGAGLIAVSQLFLAWRARDWRNLSPAGQLESLANHTLPNPYGWVCYPDNFSPDSLWCRLAGPEYWRLKVALVTVAVLGVAVLAAILLSHRPGKPWAIFAFVCVLSPMLSTIAWSHYQLLLIPMFLLLAYEFMTTGADVVDWTFLLVGYALAELVWQPFGTVLGIFRHLFTGRAETPLIEINVFVVAAFAQFVVLAAGFMWLKRARRSPVRTAPTSSHLNDE